MKKVLIISSSPKKNGNSDLLAREFQKGAEEAGNEVEFISLREKKIGYCLACGYCHTHGNVCVQKDDMNEILGKMKEADVYVLASPVYFLNICSQLKTFIDRTYPCFFELRNKELYYLLTSTDPGRDSINGAIHGLEGFEVCLPNSVRKAVLYGVDNPKHGDVKEKDQMEKAYEMGKNI